MDKLITEEKSEKVNNDTIKNKRSNFVERMEQLRRVRMPEVAILKPTIKTVEVDSDFFVKKEAVRNVNNEIVQNEIFNFKRLDGHEERTGKISRHLQDDTFEIKLGNIVVLPKVAEDDFDENIDVKIDLPQSKNIDLKDYVKEYEIESFELSNIEDVLVANIPDIEIKEIEELNVDEINSLRMIDSPEVTVEFEQHKVELEKIMVPQVDENTIKLEDVEVIIENQDIIAEAEIPQIVIPENQNLFMVTPEIVKPDEIEIEVEEIKVTPLNGPEEIITPEINILIPETEEIYLEEIKGIQASDLEFEHDELVINDIKPVSIPDADVVAIEVPENAIKEVSVNHIATPHVEFVSPEIKVTNESVKIAEYNEEYLNDIDKLLNKNTVVR